MKHIRILVHASGSDADAHLREEIPQVISSAARSGLTVEAVDRLPEIAKRLQLPSSDPDAADAALSADSTIKILAGVVRHLNPVTIRNPETGAVEVLRQPLAAILPTAKQKYPFILSDAGAHVDTPGYQIAAGALLCGSFWRTVYQGRYPRYGVLGFGEEVAKLPPDARQAYELLKIERRTVKIVEPKEIFAGDAAEVLVVRNGEIGNYLLKTAEATLSAFGQVLREEIKSELFTKVGGAFVKPAFRRAKERFYHDDVHGAFFLGINKPVMKHHGRMRADDLLLALRRLALYADARIISRTRDDFLNHLREFHPDWLAG
jgi:glycerol-3-phosphate acyltransferase PlsX